MDRFEWFRFWTGATVILWCLLIVAFFSFGLGIGDGWSVLALLILLGAAPYAMARTVVLQRWVMDRSKNPSLLAAENRPDLAECVGVAVIVGGAFLLAPREVPPEIYGALQVAGLATILIGIGLIVWGFSQRKRESSEPSGTG
ncbi:MAG: hypothetical protein L3K14_01460 [Thermoplasmata archaeon]|nr:hypothetical protein [Thermoplasmata archaeon]